MYFLNLGVKGLNVRDANHNAVSFSETLHQVDTVLLRRVVHRQENPCKHPLYVVPREY